MPLWFPWIALRRPGWACTQRKSFMGVVSVVPKLEDPKLHTFPSEQTNSTRSLTRPSLWYIHWCGICICTKIETCSQSFWQRTSQLTYPQNLKHLLSTKFDSLMAQICTGFIVRQTIYTGSWGSLSWRHRYDETCLKSWSSARQRIENWKPVLTLVRMRLQRKLPESLLDLAKEMQTSCSRSLLRCSRPTPVSKCGKTLRLSNFLHFTKTTWSVPWHMHLLFPDATNVVRDHSKKNPKLNTCVLSFCVLENKTRSTYGRTS